MSTHDKTVLIIGAGIAGSSLAYQLAKRNYQVTLLDENNQDEIEIFKNKAATSLLIVFGVLFGIWSLIDWQAFAVWYDSLG